MLFRLAGFNTRVYSRARFPNPAIVESIGARYISSLEVEPPEFARDAGNIDVVYEAMGAPQTALKVLERLGANGVFVFTGVRAPGHLALDIHGLLSHLVLRNQVIVGTVNAGNDAFETAIRDLSAFNARWPGTLEAMITAR